MAGNAVTIRARLPMAVGVTGITPQQWRVLTDAIFPSAKSADSIALALDYCKARGLDPFKRPVHIVPMWNSSLGREVETVWPGINELQVTAARSGGWAGMDEPKWGPDVVRVFKGRKKEKKGNTEKYIDIEAEVVFPEYCSVTVYRVINSVRCAFSEPVYWLEAYARSSKWSEVPNDMWLKRTRGQLHKCAKAASLRAAFPEDAGNDYTAEEMEGKDINAGGIVIEGQAEPTTGEVINDELPPSAYSEEPIDPMEAKYPTLFNEPNGSLWLRNLTTILIAPPSREAVIEIAGLTPVAAAMEKAPTLIKSQINEMINAAFAKFEVEDAAA